LESLPAIERNISGPRLSPENILFVNVKGISPGGVCAVRVLNRYEQDKAERVTGDGSPK
jgi:hypothetical protein